MDHWTENYCEEENNLLAYNRFMLDRFWTYVASLFTILQSLRFLWIQVLIYKWGHLYITLFTNDSLWI